nr:DNA mismatch repair endonuclease MutL [Spirochaetota bacterium]
SKIRSIGDLLNLSTMGFRGEALSSIETVSNFSITSNRRDRGDTPGYKLSNYGADKGIPIPVACKKGSKVEVLNLFYNLPARLKFVKSNITELNQIRKVITDKALAYKDISFSFYNDDKLVFKTLGDGDFKNAFFSINKNESPFDIFYYTEIINDDIKIDIYRSSCDIFFPTRKYQTLYVNNRPVNVNFFYPAIDNGMREYISVGRYPLVYFFIDINPSLIDINIHPAKKEIKFFNQSEIFLKIQNGISKAFSQIIKRDIFESAFFDAEDKFIENKNGLFENLKIDNDKSYYEQRNDNNYSQKSSYLESVEKTEREREFIEKNSDKRSYKIHGVCFDNYIIVEKDEKIFLVDQHAASETILFLMKKEKFKTQNDIELLLIPAIVEVDRWHNDSENKIDLLNKNGFVIEKYEGNSIIIKAMPSILLIKKDYQIALDIVLKFIESEFDSSKDIIDYILIEASCKEAVKKGDKLNLIETDEIIKEYFQREISNCPHGRPSHFEITKPGLEKIFQRKK